MEFTKAQMDELESILQIYDNARQFMRDKGNPNQWKTTEPPKETLIDDIEKGQLYVVKEDGNIEGVFMFYTIADPTYEKIYQGKWLNDQPYGTLHRVASAGNIPRLTDKIFDWAAQQIANIRIDTHRDNKPMQNAVSRNGFEYCGIIYIENGEERLAYHKVVDK